MFLLAPPRRYYCHLNPEPTGDDLTQESSFENPEVVCGLLIPEMRLLRGLSLCCVLCWASSEGLCGRSWVGHSLLGTHDLSWGAGQTQFTCSQTLSVKLFTFPKLHFPPPKIGVIIAFLSGLKKGKEICKVQRADVHSVWFTDGCLAWMDGHAAFLY